MCLASWSPPAHHHLTEEGEDKVDGRHHAISGLSMILNDTIKRGRNSHFIWAHMHAKMMTSRSAHGPDSRTRRTEPAGEPRINADSRRVLLLGGRDGLFQPIAGEDPPTAGCGLC